MAVKSNINILLGLTLICLSSWISYSVSQQSCSTTFWSYNEVVLGIGIILLARGVYHRGGSGNIPKFWWGEGVLRILGGIMLITASVAMAEDHTSTLVKDDPKLECSGKNEKGELPIKLLMYLGILISLAQCILFGLDWYVMSRPNEIMKHSPLKNFLKYMSELPLGYI
jgi:hypothetical protein